MEPLEFWPGSIGLSMSEIQSVIASIQPVESFAEQVIVAVSTQIPNKVSNQMTAKRRTRRLDEWIGLQKGRCFVCGKNNPEGMQLVFRFDKERERFFCRLRLGNRYTGPPGHCHGGIIAAVLDEAMSKVNQLHRVTAVTSEIVVKYLKPVPLNEALRIQSQEVKVTGRRHINMAEILNRKGEVLARSRGVFLVVDAHTMFDAG
jgi:uncharacterized protein (TIGR00369 family)